MNFYLHSFLIIIIIEILNQHLCIETTNDDGTSSESYDFASRCVIPTYIITYSKFLI